MPGSPRLIHISMHLQEVACVKKFAFYSIFALFVANAILGIVVLEANSSDRQAHGVDTYICTRVTIN